MSALSQFNSFSRKPDKKIPSNLKPRSAAEAKLKVDALQIHLSKRKKTNQKSQEIKRKLINNGIDNPDEYERLLNLYLMSGKSMFHDSEDKPKMEQLSRMIKKLKIYHYQESYSGQIIHVPRGTLLQTIQNYYNSGEILTRSQFISSSIDQSIASYFYQKAMPDSYETIMFRLFFIIHGYSGMKLSEYYPNYSFSYHQYEQEILFTDNRYFIVNENKKYGKNGLIISITEIEEKDNIKDKAKPFLYGGEEKSDDSEFKINWDSD